MSSKPRKPKPASQIIAQARLQISRIREWTAALTPESFAADYRTRYAVERAFIALGEAVKDLARTVDLVALDPAGPWNEPPRFRDFLAHDYDDQVIPPLIWNTITVDLSKLDDALVRVQSALAKPSNG